MACVVLSFVVMSDNIGVAVSNGMHAKLMPEWCIRVAICLGRLKHPFNQERFCALL